MYCYRKIHLITSIIFDFDGVLVESVDIKTAAFARLFADEGQDVVERVIEYHLRNGGVSRFEKIRYYYEYILRRPLSDELLRKECVRFSALVFDEVVKAPYVPGAREFLDYGRDLYDFFIVSATPQDEIDRIIDKRGMRAFFKKIIGSPLKKNEAVDVLISDFNIKPANTAFVGDALSDYDAARTHGIAFIARVAGQNDIFAGKACAARIGDLSRLRETIAMLS